MRTIFGPTLAIIGLLLAGSITSAVNTELLAYSAEDSKSIGVSIALLQPLRPVPPIPDSRNGVVPVGPLPSASGSPVGETPDSSTESPTATPESTLNNEATPSVNGTKGQNVEKSRKPTVKPSKSPKVNKSNSNSKLNNGKNGEEESEQGNVKKDD